MFLYECFERIQEEQQWRHRIHSSQQMNNIELQNSHPEMDDRPEEEELTGGEVEQHDDEGRHDDGVVEEKEERNNKENVDRNIKEENAMENDDRIEGTQRKDSETWKVPLRFPEHSAKTAYPNCTLLLVEVQVWPAREVLIIKPLLS